MRDERDERYARELSDRIDAHIAGFSLARKLGISALACVPVACAIYGVAGLLHSCPGDEAVEYPIGFMMGGGIFSLGSLVWVLLLFPRVTRGFNAFVQGNRVAFFLVFFAVVIGLRVVAHSAVAAIDRAERARCGTAQRHGEAPSSAPAP